MSACASSPAVQMWQEECGAQASVFTGAVCRCSSATGSVGNLHGSAAPAWLQRRQVESAAWACCALHGAAAET